MANAAHVVYPGTLMPAPARRIAGYEDVLAAPPEMIAEVLHGTLYLQPRPASPHALFATRLVHHGDVVAAIDPFAALALDLSLLWER